MVYLYSSDLCWKTDKKWPRASILMNAHIYMLSMYSCVAQVLEFGFSYLFLMKEELTVLSTKF